MMKTYKMMSLAIGLSAGLFAVTAQAGGFSPMASDRYSAISPAQVVEKEVALAVHKVVAPKQGFQPFAANRYQVQPFMVAAIVPSKEAVIKEKRFGFDAFSADRYYK